MQAFFVSNWRTLIPRPIARGCENAALRARFGLEPFFSSWREFVTRAEKHHSIAALCWRESLTRVSKYHSTTNRSWREFVTRVESSFESIVIMYKPASQLETGTST
jgi:hypothetical protein